MKVVIGKYKNWFGPYQLAETLCFWAKTSPGKSSPYPEWVYNFGDWLAHGKVMQDDSKFDDDRHITFLYKFLTWVDKKRNRKQTIRIDRWDTWSMDHTLALIITPMLKQLRDTTHGYHEIDPEDGPENLRVVERQDYDTQMDLFDIPKIDYERSVGELRWEYALNEMIFAFEKLSSDDWESEFYSGSHDLRTTKKVSETGEVIYELTTGPNDTFKVDYERLEKVNARINNGLRLFGKYYRGLWD